MTKEKVASALIPHLAGDTEIESKRMRYLGLRACGFKIREALALVGTTERSLRRWRKIPKFAEWEEKLPEIRRQLARAHTELTWLRNTQLFLIRDQQILEKALDGEALSRGENAYLNRARSMYTPQALAVFEKYFGSVGEEDYDLIGFIKERQRQVVLLGKRRGQPPGMDIVVEGQVTEVE